MADISPDSSKSPPEQNGFLKGMLRPERLYVVLSALLVLANARLFYGSLHQQTEQVRLWLEPESFDAVTSGLKSPSWSAPLDDVFIHFDFARAAARGFPFEWSPGNGYSSGGTSLLYPFVLAFGYLVGYRGLSLMHWAAIVGCVGTFGFLLGARRIFRGLPPWLTLLIPPTLLSTGVLNWSLFSGMEVALFLGLWGLCLVLWDDLVLAIRGRVATRLMAAVVGLACAFLVATRPEAVPLVAVFGLSVFSLFWARGERKNGVLSLLLIGVPGALVMALHLIANHLLTGDSSAAGALAKLEVHHPYLTSEQVRGAWFSNIGYQIRRVAEYHLSSVPFLGYLLWVLATLGFFFKKTRANALLLWSSVLLWILLVGLNGQVRWQNERYTMPALAWLLLAAGLGVAGTLHHALNQTTSKKRRYAELTGVAFVVALFVVAELPRFREQVWFFGRASRNIFEQHIRAGDYLRRFRSPRPHRVLVSDAGAIPYLADMPAFDLIGLGGYGHYPIAQASRQGVGAAVELIEHMPSEDRPDVMALYPSWWGTFLIWFGRPVHEFNVRGNVICGGLSKVIYEPNWSALEHSGEPFAKLPGERLVEALDVADLISERGHLAQMDRPREGYVDMKMLADPRNPKVDLWDAGRLLSGNLGYSFELRAKSNEPKFLLLRVAPATPGLLTVELPSHQPIDVRLSPSDVWQEIRIPLPRFNPGERITIRGKEGEILLYHLFVVEPLKAP